MLTTRQSEDGAVFSLGDDEFGSWADDGDDEDTYSPCMNDVDLTRVDGNKTPKGKHD
jgi:hypothetical protein